MSTNAPALARAVQLLRFNGEDRETGEYHYDGYTALLDNVQAAMLDVKLRHLPEWIAHRRCVADRYRAGLESVGDLSLPHFADPRCENCYQNSVIRRSRRDAIRDHLRESGVETVIPWANPVWEHRALGFGEPDLPNTRRICREVLSLPMSAETSDAHVDSVVDAVRRFFGTR